MKTVYFLIATFLFSLPSAAQFVPGDTLPSDLIATFLRNSKPHIAEDEWRGKFILLDFWGTSCFSCVTNMPKMKALQEKYSEQLQIVYAYENTPSEVSSFFERRKDASAFLLPMVPDDHLLKKAFPHRAIPHVIWIDPDRVVKAITGGSEVSDSTVGRWLSLRDISFEYIPHKMDYSDRRTFVENWPGEELPILRSTILTPYLPGVRSWTGVRAGEKGTEVVSLVNLPIRFLYGWVASRVLRLSLKDYHIQIKGDAYFDSLVNANEHFGLEIIFPHKVAPTRTDKAWLVANELDRLFGLRYSIRNDTLDCLQLSLPASTSNQENVKSTVFSTEFEYFPITQIADALQYSNQLTLPVVVAEADNTRADFQVPISQLDIEKVRELVASQGGQLTNIKRVFRVLYLERSSR